MCLTISSLFENEVYAMTQSFIVKKVISFWLVAPLPKVINLFKWDKTTIFKLDDKLERIKLGGFEK